MNIFYLSTDPVEAAQMMADKHVVKMIVETAQLLSTAHRVLDGEEYIDYTKTGFRIKRWKLEGWKEHSLYLATHVNHPSAIWTRQSIDNYNWLFSHFIALCDEYTFRYGKNHASHSRLAADISIPPANLTKTGFTDPPLAMPVEFMGNDAVESYRTYYKLGKSHLHKWTGRSQPSWI